MRAGGCDIQLAQMRQFEPAIEVAERLLPSFELQLQKPWRRLNKQNARP